MKLLLFSDLHASKAAAHHIVERAQSADVVIGAGDFANARRHLHDCINILTTIDCPTILVAGNNETTEELRIACQSWSSAHVLHGSAVTIDNVTFFGVGGGIPTTPFGAWSYDFSEEDARKLLTGCPKGCVLITHSPPKGALDVSSQGISLGSVAIREAVEQLCPRLVVCGHIHACAGRHTFIDTIPVVNAGPDGMFWEL